MPGAVGPELPRRDVVGQQRLEGAIDLLLGAGVLDGDHDLDAAVEVTGHEIGASEQIELLAVPLEREQAAVLEEPAEHAPDPNSLAQPVHTGMQRADAPRDDLDLGA